MTTAPRSRALLPLWIALAVAAAIVGMRVVSGFADPDDIFATADNDSLMRLVSVRDWLAGQGWFDTNSYRVLAPEGVSLHWSRYVDAGIATILWPAMQLLPATQAEATALILWPTLLLLMLLALNARAGLALFGPAGAAVAVLGAILWPVTGHAYFRPGVIDHHNVQILLLSVVILSLVGTARSGTRGLIGGAAAAASLAVGLENLLPIAAAGLILFVRAALAPGVHRAQLAAFAVALAAAGTLLFAGQTPPSEWAVAHCDELGPPVLGLVWTAAAVSLAAAWALGRAAAPRARLGIALGLGVLGAVAALPILLSCAGGPYGALPEEAQAIIATRIAEAKPAYRFALEGQKLFFSHILPALAAVTLASLLWLSGRSRDTDAAARAAAGVFLIFGWLGIAAAFFQVRLLVLAAPVVPLLMAYVLSRLLAARRAHRESLPAALALIGAAGATVFLPALVLSVSIARVVAAEPSGAPSGDQASSDCRTPERLRSLDGLPRGRVLSDLNLGTPLLAHTHHDVLAAPYHRSAPAFTNGILPFDGDEAGLRAAIAATGADYLVFCRGAVDGDGSPFWNDLRADKGAPGLAPLSGFDPALVVLKVTG
jgi:hypothetical protein